MWFQHKINIHKVRAHTCIQGNILADAFANKGPLKSPGTTHIYVTHTIPNKLVEPPQPQTSQASLDIYNPTYKKKNILGSQSHTPKRNE